MNATQLDRDRRYHATPRGKYARHKNNAKQRGIAFKLTFGEWWALWDASGLYPCIGSHVGGAVMARFGDEGPYAKGNVCIQPYIINRRDACHKASRVSVEKRHTKRSTRVSFKEL